MSLDDCAKASYVSGENRSVRGKDAEGESAENKKGQRSASPQAENADQFDVISICAALQSLPLVAENIM
jgi:hypothetical protein